MRFILVRPNYMMRWLITPPIGLGYIAAALKQIGHGCCIYDAWLLDKTPADAALDVCREYPDIIGISVFQDTVEWTSRFIALVEYYTREGKRYIPRIIVGGPYVSALGETARVQVGADVAIVGEFDNGIEGVLEQVMTLVPGDTAVIKMERTDVNEIPIPDWDSMPLPDYWPYLYSLSMPVKGKRIGLIQRSRGCSGACTFCSAGFTLGHKARIRDDDNVLEEVRYLQKRWNVNELWFSDDNVIADYQRGIELFEKLIPLNLHIRLPLGIRTENVDERMVRTMKRAGVYLTGIGIESGNPRVLKRIRKGIDLDKVRDVIHLLHEHGIITIGFFIFGCATETIEEAEDTVQYALSTELDHAQFGIFIPYPGSHDAYEVSVLPHDELVRVQRNAVLRFYARPQVLWGLARNFRPSQIKALVGHPWFRAWWGT